MSLAPASVLIATLTTLCVLAIQLWVNARQRDRDRHLQLKRDVYLEAAEGLAGTIGYVMQHTRTDIPLGAVQPPTAKPGWQFKIHLVADTDTLVAFNNAGARAATAAMSVFIDRIGVAEINDEITVVRSAIDQMQAFQQELRAEAKAIADGTPTERSLKRLEWIQQQLDQSNADLNNEIQKLETLVDRHAKRAQALVKRGLVLSSDVNRAIRRALLAARSELEMKIDTAKFESSARELDQAISSAVDAALERVDNLPAT